jgi:glycine cleavage system H lipoate-binding protein
MFLLILSISYFRKGAPAVLAPPELGAGPRVPRMEREYGFTIPRGYAFHPGHTWVVNEGRENARVGLDSFAANLLGKIDRIEVMGLNRWVRQGQKLMIITGGGVSAELLSPVEGVVIAVNEAVLKDPSLVVNDPYKDGWIAVVKSPDLATNQRNLVQESMVAPWMQNNLTQLSGLITQLSPALAQDGGVPLSGLLARVSPELQQKLMKEFFRS